MAVTNPIFWLCLGLAAGITVLLFLGHRPLAPLSTPGVNANEAAVILLMGMAVRWLLLAVAMIALAMGLYLRGRIGGWWACGVAGAGLAAHLGLGLANLWVWNYWVSVIHVKSTAQLWASAIAFFSIPLVAMTALVGGWVLAAA